MGNEYQPTKKNSLHSFKYSEISLKIGQATVPTLPHPAREALPQSQNTNATICLFSRFPAALQTCMQSIGGGAWYAKYRHGVESLQPASSLHPHAVPGRHHAPKAMSRCSPP